MKLNNITLKFLISTIYSMVLFLGNESFFGLFEVGTIINYIIVLLPVVLIFMILFDNRKNLKSIFSINKPNIFLGLIFIIWLTISFVFGIEHGSQGIKGIIHFGVIFASIILLSRIEFEKYQIETIKKHCFIALFLSVLYGIATYIFNFNLDYNSNYKYTTINGRVYSTFFIATLFDKFICFMTVYVCYEMLNKKKYRNLFLKVLLALSGIALSLTFSRTGLLIYLAILFCFFGIELIKKHYSNVIVSAITLIVIFCIPGVRIAFDSAVKQVIGFTIFEKIDVAEDKNDDPSLDESALYRDYYKKVGTLFMEEYPITGIGIGNYSYLYNNQNAKDYLKDSSVIDKHYMYPHSSYVQLGAEAGIVAVILFYLFMYSLIYNVKFKTNRKKFLMLHLTFVIFLAVSYVEGIIYSKQYIYIFVIMYALYCNYYNVNKKKIARKRKKIDLLALHLGTGGIETSIINIANSLSKKYDVRIISLYKLKNDQNNKVLNSVEVKYLLNYGPNKEDFKSSVKSRNIFKIIKQSFISSKILYLKGELIIKEILNSDSDIIISTRMNFNILLSKYGSESKIKIAQEHQYHNNNRRYINIIKTRYGRIDYLVALTKTLEKDYKEFLKKNNHTKVVTIPNMINTENLPKTNLNNKKIISVGRLVELKRFNEIIDIFSKLNKKYELVIVGDGIERKKLEKQINDLELNDRIHLVGWKSTNEVIELLKQSDVFVMTSITEGLPMVLLEAMSVGVPCVAFDIENGVKDIIKNNYNGYVVKNRDAKQFEKKLSSLLKNSKELKKLSNNAINTSLEYSFQNVTKKWINLIERKN